ncbi:unnamed protein product [Owenia fusiformis]|uniref:C2H2-type domain-containing protein n=1 Tax=Owenia fusiformis TaxID=6347 RepID=A0A8S4NMG3_OWEFU|nr:unnamed protein product [Owenia fusiformis]
MSESVGGITIMAEPVLIETVELDSSINIGPPDSSYLDENENVLPMTSTPQKTFNSSNKKHEQLLHCALCTSYSTTRKYNLKRHLETHSESSDGAPLASPSKHQCTQDNCHKSYTSKAGLAEHVRGVHGNGYSCSQCFKHLSSATARRRHELQIHEGVGFKYACEVCNKKFRASCDKEGHFNTVHRQYKPFRCSKCKKSYHYRRSLDTHKISCFGEGYTCTYDGCNATFSSHSGQIDHVAALHKHKVFKCDSCSKTYGYRSSLSKHRRQNNH